MRLYYDLDREKLHELLFKISGALTDRSDIWMFQLLPLNVQKVVSKGNLLYAGDRRRVHDIARKTIQECEEFEPRYKTILYGKADMGVPTH